MCLFNLIVSEKSSKFLSLLKLRELIFYDEINEAPEPSKKLLTIAGELIRFEAAQTGFPKRWGF